MLMLPGLLLITVWLLVKGVDLPKWEAKTAADYRYRALLGDEQAGGRGLEYQRLGVVHCPASSSLGRSAFCLWRLAECHFCLKDFLEPFEAMVFRFSLETKVLHFHFVGILRGRGSLHDRRP